MLGGHGESVLAISGCDSLRKLRGLGFDLRARNFGVLEFQE